MSEGIESTATFPITAPIRADDGLRAHFTRFAAYNAWANRRLYEVCATLPVAELERDRKGFFRSILGTLNHVLVGDRLWVARLTGQPDPAITSLDQILHREFFALRQAREAFDLRLAAVVAATPLAGDLTYRTMAGEPCHTPNLVVLAHLFNHQTHHRGQVHDMLSQAAVVPPPLDLIYFHRAEVAAAARL